MMGRFFPLGALDGFISLHSSAKYWLLAASLAILLIEARTASAVVDAGGPILPCDVPNPCPPVDSPGDAPEGVQPGMSSDRPVFLLEGAAIERITDLTLPGPVFDWSFVRTYSSGLIRFDDGNEVSSPLGLRWVSSARGPYLVSVDSNIEVVVSASNIRKFEGASLTPPGDYNATLVKTLEEDKNDYDNDTNSSEEFNIYTLTETDTGNVYIFCGFDDPAVAEAYRGRLVERTNRAYVAQDLHGTIFTYNGNGYVTSVIPAEPQDTDYIIEFNYHSSGETGRLEKVEVKKSSTIVAKAEYTYYGNVSANTALGSTGDLIQVKVSQKTSADSGSTFSIVRYTQYRYYIDESSDPGEEHQLKMVLDPDAIERITSAGNSAVDTPEEILAQSDSYVVANSNPISAFASRSFTYYVATTGLNNLIDTDTSYTYVSAWGSETLSGGSGKYGGQNIDESIHIFRTSSTYRDAGLVKTEKINAACAGCGGSTSGGVQRNYYYISINSWQETPGDKPDAVAHLIVEDTLDSSGTALYRRLYGTDYNGVAIRTAHLTNPVSPSGSNTWCWSRLQDDTWRTIQYRFPSAHKDAVTSASTLKDFLNPYNPGTDSFANDQATVSTSAGLVYHFGYNGGYPTDALVSQGRTGTQNYVSAADWGSGADDQPIFVKLATYRYPLKTATRTDSSREATTYDYDFWNAADTQFKKITTTLPTVDSGQNGSGTATTTEQYFDKVGRLRWTKDGEGFVNYYSYHPTLGEHAFMAVDADPSSAPTGSTGNDSKWISFNDDGDGNATYESTAKPTRGSSLPSVLALVTSHEFDTQGRESLTTDPRSIKHFTVYEDNRTLRFPYWDATNNQPLLPIDVREVNDGNDVTVTYTVDPTRTAQTGGVPTGLSGSTQSYYFSWIRYTYNSLNGQLQQVDRYHDVPSSGTGSLETNYYRTSFLYDTLGRRATTIQYVSSSKYQVNALIYDTLDRLTEVRRGVSTAEPTNYGDLDNTPPGTPTNFDGYATFTTIEYDSVGVGDSHITKARRFFGTGATDFVELNYHRTFRGFVRAIERKNNTSVVKPHRINDVDWLGRVIDEAQFTSTISDFSTIVSDDDYVATTSSGRNHWNRIYFDDLGRVYRTERHPGTEATKYFEINHFYDRNDQVVATGDKYAAQMEYAYDGARRKYQDRTVLELESTKYTSGKFSYRDPLPDPHWKAGTGGLDTSSVQSGYMVGGDDKVVEFTHSVLDALATCCRSTRLKPTMLTLPAVSI